MLAVMFLASKALWIIERHLTEPLTLGKVADACDVSRYQGCSMLFNDGGSRTLLSPPRAARSRIAA